MSTQLTDEQVVKVLAEREGNVEVDGDKAYTRAPFGYSSIHYARRVNYLESHDALRPVMAKLSEEEWDKLDELMTEQYGASYTVLHCQFLLTLPARDLAHAIARAIEESK